MIVTETLENGFVRTYSDAGVYIHGGFPEAKVTHNGFIWESLVDNNVWEPSDAVSTLWRKEDNA